MIFPIPSLVLERPIMTVGGANTESGVAIGNGIVSHQWSIPNSTNSE